MRIRVEYKCDECGYGYVKDAQHNSDMLTDLKCANSIFDCGGKLQPIHE
jgi:hypothetical protein